MVLWTVFRFFFGWLGDNIDGAVKVHLATVPASAKFAEDKHQYVINGCEGRHVSL